MSHVSSPLAGNDMKMPNRHRKVARIFSSKDRDAETQIRNQSITPKNLFDLEPMEFVDHIQQSVDVSRFLKLKGINIYCPIQRDKLTNDGINIREYMYNKDELVKFKKDAGRGGANITLASLRGNVKALFEQNKQRRGRVVCVATSSMPTSTVSTPMVKLKSQATPGLKLTKPYQRVNEKVEKALMRNPLPLDGIGLPQEFHQLFDSKTDQEKLEYRKKRTFASPKNLQIMFDQKFIKCHKSAKTQEQQLFQEVKRQIAPVKKYVERNIGNGLSEVKGICILDDDEKQMIENRGFGKEEKELPNEERIGLLLRNESKQSLNTISNIKNKGQTQLPANKLIQAIENLDLTSSISDISIAESENSIYESIEKRLKKVYQNQNTAIANEDILQKCPLDKLEKAVYDIIGQDTKNIYKEKQSQRLTNIKILKKQRNNKQNNKYTEIVRRVK